ncbi:resistin-like beta [Carlito syrichta]|uniref:Resistin-like beta n=1 Tax=Carlito syrichta TaxID=1868482 RepID=A0A3Q0E8J1_CARSF|nr:resistin-like beta [Carlito syrichta]
MTLMIPGRTQCSLDLIVDNKIKDFLRIQISCISITMPGKLSSCPAGMAVTSCACGYGCGSWDVQLETRCHCQCSVVDWTTARCCRLA